MTILSRLNRILAASALLSLIFLSCACLAQSTEVGKSCDLGVFGAKDTKQFLAFDQDLRSAISKQDVGKLALLIQFPLRVGDGKGMYFIHDTRSLQARFQEIFPPAIRQSILQSTRDTIRCNYTGIAYGNDRVWINVTDRGFFLMTVNELNDKSPYKQVFPEVAFACSTSKHRILVDVASDGTARYRSWSMGRPLADKPDIELTNGKNESGGTGPCYTEAWSFKNGETEYSIASTDGCSEKAPPKDAQASLSVKVPDKKEPVEAWCY